MPGKELRWLTSVVMTVVLMTTLLASPVASFGSEKKLSDTGIEYVNSDGEKIAAYETAGGLVYTKYEQDGEMVAAVLGYHGNDQTLTVSETLDGATVVSFEIDPRWPVTDELYDSIESISLPATIETVESDYLSYFTGLKSISIPDGNEYYKSESGVLYEYNDTGCELAAYPDAKTDTTYVMPSDLNEMPFFNYGCPIESLTISKSISEIGHGDLYNLDFLKEITVEEGNTHYYSKDGVLFHTEKESIYVAGEEPGDINTLFEYPVMRTGSTYTVPEDVDRIDYEAFSWAGNLRKVIIPESVYYIGNMAFYGAENLAEIELKGAKAPEQKYYTSYEGLRDFVLDQDPDYPVTVTYPSDGTGWESFIKYLKGQELNDWEEEPDYIESLYNEETDEYEVPLGSTACPIEGEPMYGTTYPVYSNAQNGTFTKTYPNAAGTWYVKLKVDEKAGYTGIESEAYSFDVVDLGVDQKENRWLHVPKSVLVEYGDAFVLNASALFGKVDQVLYKKRSAADTDANWTATKPKKPGEYDYKLVVNDTSAYKGIVYIATKDPDGACWITIDKQSRYVSVYCDDIAVGEKPAPSVTFYEDSVYDDIDLSLVTFKYYKYTYDTEAGEWQKEEKTESEITELGEYSVEPVYESETLQLAGSDFFNVRTKEDLARTKIEELSEPAYITTDDKADIDAASKAYNTLSDGEKAALGEDAKKALDNAVARIKTLTAQEELEDVLFEYENAYEDYEEALSAATKAKTAADKAYKTNNVAAIKAAVKAKTKADALKTAAAAFYTAAKSVDTAAKAVSAAASEDPVMTRLEKQNAARYLKETASLVSSAKTASTSAATLVKTTTTLVTSAQTRYENTVKAYKVTGLKAKALKKKKARVTWKANKLATGYQIQYSRYKSMKKAKTVVVKKATTKKATLKKLAAKEKYYIRIRTYLKYKSPVTSKTRTLYGKWTGKKAIKAKK